MRKVKPLGYDESLLEARGGLWTAREIEQQPDMLRATQSLLESRRAAIEAFLAPLLATPGLRVILTGAGTSAFIGDSLAPWLAARTGLKIDSLATTDLVSAPQLYFERDRPTLLVSFGRSGNSPESLAAAELADRFVAGLHHLAISCNEDSALVGYVNGAGNGFSLILPPETHDHGFAMTSSYTCMMYACLAVFSGIGSAGTRVSAVADALQGVLSDYTATLGDIASQGYERVAFLGSHIFKGTAREAALKLMELTNGAVVTLYDSPLGFRHGPKTFVNGRTLVFLFLSNDDYTRRYELDLLSELKRDGEAGRIVVVAAHNGVETPDQIRVHGLEAAEDCDLLFPYIAAAQIFAFHQSILRGLTPDQPNASGTVNRVVQGVKIHERA